MRAMIVGLRSAKWKVLAPWGLAFVLGWVCPGLFWPESARRNSAKPAKPVDSRLNVSVAVRRETASSGDTLPTVRAPSGGAPEADARSRPAWAPSSRGAGLRSGASGAPDLHTLLWMPLSGGGPPTTTPTRDYSFLARHFEWAFLCRSSLGQAPWSKSRFSVVGSVESRALRVVGRDFILPASPQMSLEWYCRDLGVRPDPEKATAGLRLLQEFEQQQQDFIQKALSRAYQLSLTSQAEVPASAFAVDSSRVLVVPPSRVASLDSLPEEVRFDFDFLKATVKRVLR